jgi:hypothetical protein
LADSDVSVVAAVVVVDDDVAVAFVIFAVEVAVAADDVVAAFVIFAVEVADSLDFSCGVGWQPANNSAASAVAETRVKLCNNDFSVFIIDGGWFVVLRLEYDGMRRTRTHFGGEVCGLAT